MKAGLTAETKEPVAEKSAPAPAPQPATAPVPPTPARLTESSQSLVSRLMNAEQCERLAQATIQKLDETPEPQLRASLADAQRRCPTDRRYQLAFGFVELRMKNWAKAAEIFTAFVLSPEPPMIAFSGLAGAYKKLDAAGQDQIRQLGVSSDSPIYVPNIGAEYGWVATFGCESGRARVGMQSLARGKHRVLDRLTFHCPNGTERSLFFDYSADPTEKEIQKSFGSGGQ